MIPLVSVMFWSADPDVYWFFLTIEEADGSLTPVALGPASVVLVERQVGPGWSSDLALTVALAPLPFEVYAIRTIIPASVASGQERIIRLTVDGVVYGPWSFRFHSPV